MLTSHGDIDFSKLVNLCPVKTFSLISTPGKLAVFSKIYKNKSPFYLFKLIPEKTSSYNMKNVDAIPLIKIKYNFFKNTFFPSTVIEWNKLDLTIWNAESFSVSKHNILKFITPTQESFSTVTFTKAQPQRHKGTLD